MRQAIACVVTLLAGASLVAQNPPAQGQAAPPQGQTATASPQQQPVFRSGIDVIRIDVSVLDKERRPVTGLKAEDFTVVESGKPQRIVAVTEMVGSDRDPTPSAWMRHVPPDVAANDLTDMAGDGRFVAVVMDDWNIPFDDPDIILNARQVGRYLIDQLGPSDVAAVVFPQQAGKTQDFTSDRQKLITAIDKFEPPEVRWIPARPMGPGPGGGDMPQRFAPVLMRTDCQRSQPLVPTLDTVVGRLASVPNRRKTVIVVTIGIPLTFTNSRGCPGELADIMKEVFRKSQRANVNIYSIDPAGQTGYSTYLQTPVHRGGRAAERIYSPQEADQAVRVRRDFLEIVADYTAARAIVNTDELSREIDRVMTEASSYYLVGYQTSNGQPDGKFRRLEVRVNRPGLTVRTRSGFYAPDENGTKDRNGAPTTSDLGLTGMSSPSGLALRAQVVALGPAGTGAGGAASSAKGAKDADVAVVVGVRTPGMRLESADTLTLVRVIYDATGNAGPPAQEKVEIAIPPSGSEDLRYEVFQRLRLAPGRWELRMNASSARLDSSGTVYAEFEVPDFTRRSLALSGIFLGQAAGEGRKDPLAGLVPLVPTTARDFAPSEEIKAFLRVHQGGTGAVVPIKMSVQMLNISDENVFESTSTLPASAFEGTRWAPFEIGPPLAKLVRGPYLLSISAELPDGSKSRADIVFRIR